MENLILLKWYEQVCTWFNGERWIWQGSGACATRYSTYSGFILTKKGRNHHHHHQHHPSSSSSSSSSSRNHHHLGIIPPKKCASEKAGDFLVKTWHWGVKVSFPWISLLKCPKLSFRRAENIPSRPGRDRSVGCEFSHLISYRKSPGYLFAFGIPKDYVPRCSKSPMVPQFHAPFGRTFGVYTP